MLTKGIDEVVQQHDDIWRKLEHHEKALERMKMNGRLNRSGNALSTTTEESGVNQTQNARVDHHFVYDERRGDKETINDISEFYFYRTNAVSLCI